MDVGGLTPIDRSVEGVVEMILDATQQFDLPLTKDRLFNWQGALFPSARSGLKKIEVGQWRSDKLGPMQVTSGYAGNERVHYEAPAAERLEIEMHSFLEWFNAKSKLDPVIEAAIAHLWFVTIHPFEDGNGRIARAVADMALARSEKTSWRFYSMSTQIRVERTVYYDILEATQKGNLDITAWLEWFLDCLDRAFDSAEMTLASVLAKARFWEEHAEAKLGDRQRLIVNRLLNGFQGKLTSSKYAILAKCSQDTAARDIDDLIKQDILMKDAGGGRGTSYSLVMPGDNHGLAFRTRSTGQTRRKDIGHGDRMGDVRIAIVAPLVAMGLHRHDIGRVDQVGVGLRIVGKNFLRQFELTNDPAAGWAGRPNPVRGERERCVTP